MMFAILQSFVPPSSLAASAILFGTLLHTESRASRIWLTPVFLFSSYYSLATPDQFYFSFPLMSLWNLGVGLYVAHAISLFHIEHWAPPERPPGLTWRQRWTWKIATTYRLWGNPRIWIPESRSKPAQSEQSLRSFVISRLCKLALYYVAHAHVVPALNLLLIGDIRPSDVNATQRTVLRSLWRAAFSGEYKVAAAPLFAARALLVRSHTALFWILESVVFLDGANAALGLFFVRVIQADSVQDWPALFGSLIAATSVSRFWNRFWHQIATRPYVNFGLVVARQIIRTSGEQGVYDKLVVAAVVFFLSGCNHAIVTWQASMKDWDREIWWFMLNFCACAAEKFLSMLVINAKPQLRALRWLDRKENRWIKIVIGRTWLFAFFCWSVPKWQYARMEKQAVAAEDIARLRRILSRG